MEAIVETSLEATNYLVDKHFDKGWDKYQKYVNGKKVEEEVKPYRRPRTTRPSDTAADYSDSSPSSTSNNRLGQRTPAASRGVHSSADFSGGAPLTGAVPPAVAGATLGATTFAAAYPSSAARRTHRNQLPSPERDIDREYRRDSIRSLHQESEVSDRVLREYEREVDDPSRRPESVLPDRDLKKTSIKRDSVMTSGYNDNYTQGGYAAERPRSQPPRSRYYDDDDSDYDERSGRRYAKGSGRGYEDDRDYDRVYEETERYRGPPANRPWDGSRRESYRSGYDEPYGAGTVAQYRRSDGALDRREESYVSRRSKSRGRDRDRSYSRSRSRSRSEDRDRGGIKDKLENTFDVSGRGLGVGIAGAVIGGLAGREFGGKAHRQRDVMLGALVGGLGANIAENKWREWKGHKEERLEREEYEAYGGRDIGRSRSNVR
ncbi:hypothetical protein M409DRAFT_21257 [Zasmidium cellare ATCC 36951]|uniref:Glycine zipper 2TM domain-containing protein n=1 Tax=Zasmidium cellare ATCC 36951 TaxID=1080233 RepID=A0A6A6CQN5_ZASCE|nr:uncharacterized protein M409DRAFT_21257 [Zasmidium cellare ATCC 36951]KAF2168508.1 hypothetical protein M409DRAFT_21257 [Zasmidium cellare ATCC 36951]